MKRATGNRKGFVLACSLIIVALVVLSVAGYFIFVSNDLTMADRIANSIRAYYIADAGLADAYMRLRSYPGTPSSFTVGDGSFAVGPGSCTGSYQVQVASNGSPWPTYTMTSQGTYRGSTKTLVLSVTLASCSKWAYLSQTEIDPFWGDLWWVTGMTTTGPCHTNGRFNMWGDPVFDGPVSQVASSINYWNGGPPADDPDFQHGLTLNAPALAMPSSGDLIQSIKTAAFETWGVGLTGNTTIVLLSDGTMNVTNAQKGWTNSNQPLPTNFALFVTGGVVHVSGVLKGALTIGCDSDIVIDDSIVYNTDPREDPSSTDMLGLVALRDIIVSDDASHDMEIDAYLTALTGSFEVENFWASLKGDMVQFGGLTNYVCGPTGMFNPWTGQMVAGYMQLQFYDERFEETVPAWFLPVRDADNRLTYRRISFAEM